MAAPGRMAKAKQRESLNGWQQIAAFLGSQHRWLNDGQNPGCQSPARVGGCWLRRRN
jgi:hypothetical protein